jgi:Domain of unknown function (DUF1844)
MTMSTENREQPQIFVDEDWKSQVEAEKKAAAERQSAGGTGQRSEADLLPGPEGTPPAASYGATESPRTRSDDSLAESSPAPPLPPATLSFLITTLATQAMVSLGQVPNPFSGKVEIRLPEARHFIDTLTTLEEKTGGNRTPEESALLRGALHQLRLAYIEAERIPASGTK